MAEDHFCGLQRQQIVFSLTDQSLHLKALRTIVNYDGNDWKIAYSVMPRVVIYERREGLLDTMGYPRPLFVYFRSFSNKQYKFYNKLM